MLYWNRYYIYNIQGILWWNLAKSLFRSGRLGPRRRDGQSHWSTWGWTWEANLEQNRTLTWQPSLFPKSSPQVYPSRPVQTGYKAMVKFYSFFCQLTTYPSSSTVISDCPIRQKQATSAIPELWLILSWKSWKLVAVTVGVVNNFCRNVNVLQL